MPSPKLIGAAAITGALALGGFAGAVLGVPGISSAQNATTPTTTTAPASPNDGGPGMGPRRGMGMGMGIAAGLDPAAKVLGLSVADLRTELQGGRSLADVAKEKGVDKQKVVDALVSAADTRLDSEKAKVPGQIAKLVDGQFPMGPVVRSGAGAGAGHRGFGGPGMEFPAAAKALGLSEADLQTALKGGKSLADVAKDKGVSEQTLIDAMVASAKDRLATEVTSGHLTQDQANQRIVDLPAQIKNLVEHAGGFAGRGGPGQGWGRPGGFGRRGNGGQPAGPGQPGDGVSGGGASSGGGTTTTTIA